jgi:hypothetical protein
MPPWLGHDFRVRHTALEQERPERIGLKDLAPWFDRPIEFRILLMPSAGSNSLDPKW